MRKMKWIWVAGLVMGMGGYAHAEIPYYQQGDGQEYFQEWNQDWEGLETIRTIVSKEVGPKMATYTVNIANCGRDLSHVRLRVSRSGMRVDGGGALFADGSRKSVGYRKEFAAGYVGGWLSTSYLGGFGRCIKSIYVNAQSTSGVSLVEIDGKFK